MNRLFLLLAFFVVTSVHSQEKEITQFFGYNLGVSHLLVKNELGGKYKESRWSNKDVLVYEGVDALGFTAKVTFYFGGEDKLRSGIINFENNSFTFEMVGESIDSDYSYEGIQKYEKIKSLISDKYGEGIESPGAKKLEEVIKLDTKKLLGNGSITYFSKWTLLNGDIILSVDKEGGASLVYKTGSNNGSIVDKSIL